MPRDEFLRNLQRGLRSIGPVTVVRVPPGTGTEDLQLDLWLTPGTIDGYAEEDFAVMPEADRASLTAAVAEFRQIAERVAPTAPATPEAVRSGRAALERLRDILTRNEYLLP